MASKTARRHERGTMGLAAPVEVSHSKVVSVPGRGTSVSTSPVMAVRYAWTSASACCACSILRRSRLGSPVAMHTEWVASSTQERESATALSRP